MSNTLPASKLIKAQSFTTDWREYKDRGHTMRIRAALRYDDSCGNGHNTFSITGETQHKASRDWRGDSGGCIHEEIAKHFPEYARVIKWHLVSSDGPMHYVSNTCYHAGNRDHNGLLAGEKRQIIDRKTGLPAWELKALDRRTGEEVSLFSIDRFVDSIKEPECPYDIKYVPWCRVGEGKARDFDAARSCAVWPEATDEQLSLPREELEKLLLARLPALMQDFKAAMESLGFVY